MEENILAELEEFAEKPDYYWLDVTPSSVRALLDQYRVKKAQVTFLKKALQEIIDYEQPDYGNYYDPDFYDGWRDAQEEYVALARAALQEV